MRESELKTELKILAEILTLTRNGRVGKEMIRNMYDRRVTELIHIEDLNARVVREKKLVDCDLSVRSLNCLKAKNIDTVNDLLNVWPIKPYQYRNLGHRTINELELFLLRNALIKD